MKFFTAAWTQGEFSDEEAEAVVLAYWAHISTLADRMPATVYTLAHGVNIHDGRLRAALFDRPRATVTFGRLALKLEPMPDREFDRPADVYSEVL
jgi:hypothetical protein